jgi:hypothetical protein
MATHSSKRPMPFEERLPVHCCGSNDSDGV